MGDIDIKAIISDIMASERYQSSSHFSSRVYTDEPIITTGRQMASYLPEEYRKMRAVSRWQENRATGRGRWLTTEELFYKQAVLMADYEDDCPYHGTFKSYYPTYNDMSDRQLRGYFTWRAQVRRGIVEETSLSFAYTYLYELLCGVGVTDPTAGYHTIEDFRQAYRAFAPELDRYVRVWLMDYVVYHNLPRELLGENKTVVFDQALIALERAQDTVAAMRPGTDASGRKSRRAPALPLPVNEELEETLFHAIDELSTYRIASSRFTKDHYCDVRHVTCAVYVRLADHYDKSRKLGLIESFFGERLSLPYTMFGSAVFFDPQRHPDCVYELDEVHRYRCHQGLWTCERFHGSRSRSPKLGSVLRAVDRMMRETWDYPHPLKDEAAPKYLATMISKEIEEWRSWSEAHKPAEVKIDLSQLRSIRETAAETREALLIDEERTGVAPVEPTVAPEATVGCGTGSPDSEFRTSWEALNVLSERAGLPERSGEPVPQPAVDASTTDSDTPLSPSQRSYLAALASGDSACATAAVTQANGSEDMLVDSINEALFDLVGDTVIEYAADGPALIEDYREDVERILSHGRD